MDKSKSRVRAQPELQSTALPRKVLLRPAGAERSKVSGAVGAVTAPDVAVGGVEDASLSASLTAEDILG